jgi:hypothetical protein
MSNDTSNQLDYEILARKEFVNFITYKWGYTSEQDFEFFKKFIYTKEIFEEENLKNMKIFPLTKKEKTEIRFITACVLIIYSLNFIYC